MACFQDYSCLAERQELMAVGSRHFGHPAISSLIRVKIYDFAMYMDGGQVRLVILHNIAMCIFCW